MTDAMIVEVLQKVVGRQDLSREEAYMVMEFLMTGRASDAEIAAFLTAMRMKGETVEELCGFVQVMRGKVTAVHTRYSGSRRSDARGYVRDGGRCERNFQYLHGSRICG
jgi:anthranilate phosphoribosyltransferase